MAWYGMMTSVNLDEAYAQSRADLVRFATALVGADDALDVVSEVVASTLSRLRVADVDELRAYWFRAVANRSRSWHRSRLRRRARETRAGAQLSGPDHEMMAADIARGLLAWLTPQQRVVVYLTYWHDWDPATIASTLGVSEGTVRKQLARGRERLRGVMSSEP